MKSKKKTIKMIVTKFLSYDHLSTSLAKNSSLKIQSYGYLHEAFRREQFSNTLEKDF